jgi:hypothetical protein
MSSLTFKSMWHAGCGARGYAFTTAGPWLCLCFHLHLLGARDNLGPAGCRGVYIHTTWGIDLSVTRCRMTQPQICGYCMCVLTHEDWVLSGSLVFVLNVEWSFQQLSLCSTLCVQESLIEDQPQDLPHCPFAAALGVTLAQFALLPAACLPCYSAACGATSGGHSPLLGGTFTLYSRALYSRAVTGLAASLLTCVVPRSFLLREREIVTE